VSVGGTITTGGFGWLSGDLGCISDPKNLLDVEVVKYDGSVVWASSEPELLWAIRGGGGGFGGQLHCHQNTRYLLNERSSNHTCNLPIA
jgi:hypothetical protein